MERRRSFKYIFSITVFRMNSINFALTFSTFLYSCQLINGGLVPTFEVLENPMDLNGLRVPREAESSYKPLTRVTRGVYDFATVPPITTQSNNDKSGGGGDDDLASLKSEYFPMEFPSNSSIIQMDKDKASFVEAFLKCAPISKYCLLTTLGTTCGLACLMDNFEVSKNTIFVIDHVAESLCSPLGSFLDYGISLMREHPKQIKRLSQYLSMFGIESDVFGVFASGGTDALPMQLIKYGKNPLLDSFKPIVASLESTLNGAQTGFPQTNFIYNPICEDVDLYDSVQKIAEQFTFTPFSVDITLGGWFVAMNVANLEMGKLDPLIQSIMTVFKIMVGAECSLVQYSVTGKVTDCKLVTGERRISINSNKDKPTNNLICGSLPDLPDVDLHKLLPDIFPEIIDYGDDYAYDTESGSTNNVK